MSAREPAGDKAVWSLTYGAQYPDLANFNKKCAQAQNSGPIIPVAAK